jgi:hypothetical protein
MEALQAVIEWAFTTLIMSAWAMLGLWLAGALGRAYEAGKLGVLPKP